MTRRSQIPLAAVSLAAALAVAATARTASARTPLPERRPDRWVYDAAEVIDPAGESSIEQLATGLFQRTGVAIVVITVPQLVDETIDELAVRLGQEWGVGRKGQDRGLVIAFSRDDRRIFVATGYGTEGYLPDGLVGALIDQYAIPHLKANRFSEGLVALAGALASVSAKEFGVDLPGAPTVTTQPPPERPKLGLRQLILGALFLIVLIYMAIRHPWLLLLLLASGRGRHGGGFGGGGGHGGFGGGGFGGGGAGRGF